MNITLTPDLEAVVEESVRSGRFGSRSAVMREALRMFKEQEEFLARNRDRIRTEIDEGIASAERGELYDADEVFEELISELDAEIETQRR